MMLKLRPLSIGTSLVIRASNSTSRSNRNNISPTYLYSTYASVLTDSFYNEEQLEMQRSLRKIIDGDINPNVDKWEAEEQIPTHELFKKLGNAGFLGVNKPTEAGGLGLSYKHHAAFLEELGTIRCAGVPVAICAQTDMATPALSRFGSPELQKEFLEPAVRGTVVTCIGVTEPGAGSDVAAIKTTAAKDGDDLVINGEKKWILNGMVADWICLLANTSQGAPHKNKSLICVPLNVKGITRSNIRKLGLHSVDTAHLRFENVRVPQRNIIGKEGAGFKYQMLQFQEDRLAGVLLVLKSLDTVIGETLDYTRERKAFGTSLLDNQVIQFRLAELATEVEALRALTYSGIDLNCKGENVTRLASMIKLKAGRVIREVADSCLQYWGGMGYSAETYVSRYYRDGRALSLVGGADEVILSVICRLIGIGSNTK